MHHLPYVMLGFFRVAGSDYFYGYSPWLISLFHISSPLSERYI